MEGHSTGLKIIAYPHKTGGTAEDGGIHIKFYINSDALTSGVPNNNWRLAADIFDTGQILGDGYEWPDYQELEVRNSDTDNSGFFHNSVYFRFLTDADLQALRSGNPGGGGSPPPVTPPTGTPVPGLGAVVNKTYIQSESANIWDKVNAEAVIKDTLNRQLLPVTGVDFLNTLYIVIGPPDLPLKDINAPPIGGSGGSGGSISSSGGTRDVNISLTFDLVFPAPIESEVDARNDFQVAVSEEMIEIQCNPFPDNTQGGWFGPTLGDDPIREIGDTPCDGSIEAYTDGLDVEAYWSNEDDDCIIPGLNNGTGDNAAKLTYHGGVIMRHPTIWMIFWGLDWDTRTGLLSKANLIADVRDRLLGTDKQFFDGIAQYDCGVPVWGGAVKSAPTPFPPDKWEEVLSTETLLAVVADTINAGIIPLSGIDFNNTQFIVVPAQDALGSVQWQKMLDDPDGGFGAYHVDLVVSVTDPISPTSNLVYPEAGSRHDTFKPTINLPHPGGEGTGGGVLPPDVSIPPEGATVINPVVSWAVLQVIDSSTSIIHAAIPEWDNNNVVTRPLELSLIHSQVNTDQYARFGPAGWSRDTGSNNQIGESPCYVTVDADNIHIYGDGLGVQAYWSNIANNCVVPGRGDLDLGTSTDVKYHGGRIMKNPFVVLIFWGPAWLTRVDIPSVESLTTEVKDKLLDNDKVFFSQLGQYGGCGAPQFGASVINTNIPFPASHVITLDQARAVVKSTLQNGSLPTALIDFNNTWFCVIPEYTTNVIDPVTGVPDVPYWSDVFQPTIVIPGTGPEDPGGSPDPGDLETFSGVLSFKRDINAMRTSTCAGTDLPPVDPGAPPVDPPPPPGTGGTAKFYIVTGTSNQKEISNESSSSNRTIIAEKINSSSSAMNGKLLKQADCLLKKESGTTDVTPLISFKIWNAANSVVYTSPTTFTPASLTTSFVGKTFDCSTNTHTLVVGDYVGVEFTGTDPDQFIWTAYVTSDSGSTGSSGSYSIYKEGSSYDDQTSRRCSFTLWT
jgi:hypothetical protein